MTIDTRQDLPDTIDDLVIIYSCTDEHIFPGIIAFTSGDDEQSHTVTSSAITVDVDNNCITVFGHAIAYHDIPHSIYVSHVTYLQLATEGCPPLDDMKSIQSSPLWLHDFPMSQELIDHFIAQELIDRSMLINSMLMNPTNDHRPK